MSNQYNRDKLIAAVNESKSYSETIRKMGLNRNQHDSIRDTILSLKLDISHFTHAPERKTSKRDKNNRFLSKEVKDILVIMPKDSYHREKRANLLKAMLSSGLNYLCMMPDCEKPEPIWRGEMCTLDIDHINGNWRDNRIENLRFLCGRCHGQTKTNTRSKAINPENLEDFIIQQQAKYFQKDKKCKSCDALIWRSSIYCNSCCSKFKVKTKTEKYPPAEMLKSMVEETSYVEVGRIFGVSGNAIKKYLKIRVQDLPIKQVRAFTEEDKICKCGSMKSLSSKQCRACSHVSNRKAKYPDNDVLLSKIKDIGVTAVASELGVSRSSVIKYARRQNISY